jgi:hypothetical protein
MFEAKSIERPDVGASLFSRLGKTPFKKQLAWHANCDEPTACVMTITPLMADELLRRNQGEDYRNRTLSASTLDKYTNEMRRGWKLTGETVILSKSGRLLNGQHRLHACIASQREFQTFVVFGVDDDAFAFMDVGRKRTAGDIFSIHGVADANKMASATLWIWKYHNTKMMNPEAGKGPTPDQLYSYYLAQAPDLPKSVAPGSRFRDLAPPSLMTALHHLCSLKNAEQAMRFFDGAASGINLGAKDAALKLRNRLIEGRTGGERLSDIYIAAFTVMAWNALRQRRSIGIFRWRGEQNPTQSFPSII